MAETTVDLRLKDTFKTFLQDLPTLGTFKACSPVSNEIPPEPMVKCKDSKSPLFANKMPNDVLNVEIIADHQKLNSGEESRPGVIVYEENGKKTVVGTNLKPRGNSRASCFPKPLKAEFESEEQMKSLGGRSDSTPESLYKKLVTLREKTKFNKAVSQDTNIFDKLGDDIKIVNPCEIKGERNWLGAEDLKEQEEKLLREFYTYKILEELGTSTLKTRLAHITYKNPDGTISSSGYSFFREPESKVASRCGQIKGKGDKDNSATSEFQTKLIFAFIGGIDYNINIDHNIAFMHSEAGTTSYIPYDFDTSALVTPYYTSGNNQEAKEYMVLELEKMLSRAPKEIAKIQTQQFLGKKEEILLVIKNSLLNKSAKEDVLEKINLQFGVLEKFIKN